MTDEELNSRRASMLMALLLEHKDRCRDASCPIATSLFIPVIERLLGRPMTRVDREAIL